MKRDLFIQAYGAMRHDLRKTVLTILGMAWGIATVVLLLAYGDGFGRAIQGIFETFGAKAVGVYPGRTSQQAGGNKAGVQVRFTQEDVELVRNVPVLLQLLMWYFVLSDMLPTSDEALSPLPGIFLSKSGLAFPVPESSLAWLYVAIGLVLGILASVLYLRHAGRTLYATGRQLPRVWPVVVMLVVGVLLACAFGALIGHVPLTFDIPEKSEINISGGAAVTPEFLAVFLGLSTYTAAFVAEVVRAGVQSVQHGQLEAARSLGLGRVQQLRLVILPQAMRVILPSLTNQYLNLTKNSSLAVAVGYPDLVSIANTSLNQTGRAFECVAIIMAVYISLSLLTALFMNRFNRRAVLRGRR